MALKDLKRIKLDNRDTETLQENVREYLGQLNPIVLSGIIVDATVGTSTTLINHGLARKFQGWHLLDVQGDARVWRDATSTADSKLFLPLRASASVNVKLWVF